MSRLLVRARQRTASYLSAPPTLRLFMPDNGPRGPRIDEVGVTCGSSSACGKDDFQFQSCPGTKGGGPSASSVKSESGSAKFEDEP